LTYGLAGFKVLGVGSPMAAKIADILKALETIAPLSLAEEWDNPGLQVGSKDMETDFILFSLDPTARAISKAIEKKIPLIITHHPLIFRPLRSLSPSYYPGQLIYEAVKNGTTIYAAHTNLDSCANGLNEIMARIIGVRDMAPLDRCSRDPLCGIGRIGNIGPVPFGKLLNQIQALLGPNEIRFMAPETQQVQKIAVVTGSGGSLLEKAFQAGCDLLITGDLEHHHYLTARALGMGLLDISHHMGEELPFREFAFFFQKYLKDNGLHVEIEYLRESAPPFEIWGVENTHRLETGTHGI